MKKQTIYILLLVVAVGAFAVYIFMRPDENIDTNNDANKETENEETQEESEDVENDEDEEVSDDVEETEEERDTDLSEYSSDSQTVGEDSESAFTIESISNSSKDGYHEIRFVLTSDSSDEPYVNASYNKSSGVIRVQLNNIAEDNSGIAHQDEESINLKGVTKIYRNISSIQDEEIYDIGLSSETVFKLSSNNQGTGEWNIVLQVKYPGDTNTTTEEINLGSETFSTGEQNITGVGVEKNASITSYTYSRNNGILKFVWNVTADGDSPIPLVSAKYDEEGILQVVFGSLVMDRVGGSSSTISLYDGISLVATRSGDSTTYVFDGVEEGTEFKLSASTSPNQVIMEVK